MTLLCAFALFGMFGCKKPAEPDPADIDEPVDGAPTVSHDPDAPKTIGSKEIRDLRVNFFTATRFSRDENHEFRFEVKKDENGNLTASEENTGLSVPADGTLLQQLQEIIDTFHLAQKNGEYESNLSLSPEFHDCNLEVNYASGERLKFTMINNPFGDWTEKMYDVFAKWFASQGEEGLYPEKEDSEIKRMRFEFEENGISRTYSGINVQEKDAINGERYLLEKQIYDYVNNETKERVFILFPEDYYAKLTEIVAETDLVRNYDFSRYDREAGNYGNHEKGYFGWGDKTTADGEEDAEDLCLTLHIEFESGNRINIETQKASEIEAMRPLIEELIRFHETLFE